MTRLTPDGAAVKRVNSTPHHPGRVAGDPSPIVGNLTARIAALIDAGGGSSVFLDPASREYQSSADEPLAHFVNAIWQRLEDDGKPEIASLLANVSLQFNLQLLHALGIDPSADIEHACLQVERLFRLVDNEQIVEAAISCWQAGEDLDFNAFVEANTPHADELRELFPILAKFDRRGCLSHDSSESQTERRRPEPLPYEQLGDFRLLREIGRGGMGVVFEAEQISFGRRVALKVLPITSRVDNTSLKRFRNEVRAAAALDHPHIVAVYSDGSEHGVHFYAMQLIRGQTLAELIEQLQRSTAMQNPSHEADTDRGKTKQDTSTADALSTTKANEATRVKPGAKRQPAAGLYRMATRIGVQAADALQHAHDQGVLHRDIKPSNLLLGSDEKLYVTDFGLARIETEASITMSGTIVGTLRYMAPEQALAKRVIIDHRADIYSLGATLYELLALRPAFNETDRSELLKQIAFEDPRPLRKLDPRIPVDLETIVRKAMAKHPDERYETAQGLASDLRAFLEDRPIKAKPPTLIDRAAKWSRRHQAVVWSVSAGLLAIVALLAVSMAVISAALTQEKRALGQVAEERNAGYQSLYVAQMRLAQHNWERGDIAKMQELLDEHLPRPGRADLRGWEWYYLQSLPAQEALCFRGHFDARDSTDRDVIAREWSGVLAVAWSPDGRLVASTAFNTQEGNGVIKIWDPNTGAEVQAMRPPARVLSLSWSPDGHRLVAFSSDLLLTVWDTDSGERQIAIKSGIPDANQITVSWDTTGERFVAPGAKGSAVIWDAKTGVLLQRLEGYGSEICDTLWSPDGRSIAATGFGKATGSIVIWDVASEQLRRTLWLGYRGWAGPLSWSPDSARIASGADSGLAQVWDADTGNELLTLRHYSAAKNIAFSPDGERLVTGVRGNRVTVWNAKTGAVERQLQGHDRKLNSIAWSPDGKRLVTSAQDGLVKIWNVDRDNTLLPQIDNAMGTVLWSPDDRLLAYGAVDKTFIVCDAATGRRIHVLEGFADMRLRQLAWNSDGHYLACSGDEGTIRVWDAVSGKVLHTWMHHGTNPTAPQRLATSAISWHPDGRRLASHSDFDGEVRIWDVPTATLLDSFYSGQQSPNPGDYNTGLAWSPDGQRLATADMLHGIKIWDVNGWRQLHIFDNDIIQMSTFMAWSPDSRFLAASGSAVAPLKIFEIPTGRAVLSIFGQSSQAALSWDSEGRRLLASDSVGSRLWDAATGEQLLTFEPAAAWSHDRKRIAVVVDHKIRIQDVSAGYKLAADPAFRRYRAQEHATRMLELTHIGNDQQALSQMELALNVAPNDPLVQARASWFLSTCADPQIRDSVRALELGNLAAPSRLTWQTLGIKYPEADGDERAANKLNHALRLVPDDPQLQELAARFLATCTDTRLREPLRALELADKATRASPASASAWQTLAWALYRNREWEKSIEALQKSFELRGDEGSPSDWCCLAMAHWQLGNHDLALQWYDKSVAFTHADASKAIEFQRFHAEAATVLGLSPIVAVNESAIRPPGR